MLCLSNHNNALCTVGTQQQQSSSGMDIFKKDLKTYLFYQAFSFLFNKKISLKKVNIASFKLCFRYREMVCLENKKIRSVGEMLCSVYVVLILLF